MTNGWVRTSRGVLLNLEQLISRARKPIGNKADLKDTVVKRRVPNQQVINVRGFLPTQGDAPKEVRVTGAETVEPKVPLSAYTGNTAGSLADLTGVKVDQAKYHKKKGKSENLEATTNAALHEVFQELKATTHQVVEPASDWQKE